MEPSFDHTFLFPSSVSNPSEKQALEDPDNPPGGDQQLPGSNASTLSASSGFTEKESSVNSGTSDAGQNEGGAGDDTHTECEHQVRGKKTQIIA